VTKVRVKPEAKFSFSCSDRETVDGAPGKVWVLPGPFEDLELRLTGEEESLPGPVEMIPELDGTGDQGTEHILLDILDTEQRRTARLGLELPVETGQTEAVGVGGEEKSPGGSDSARRKMVGEVSDELLR